MQFKIWTISIQLYDAWFLRNDEPSCCLVPNLRQRLLTYKKECQPISLLSGVAEEYGIMHSAEHFVWTEFLA
jgi:hypothetical protein